MRCLPLSGGVYTLDLERNWSSPGAFKVLVRPDVSALEKILDGKIHVLRIDEFWRRRFGAKGRPYLNSILTP
jgi:hypothetical protein